jgi:hypothetical protein
MSKEKLVAVALEDGSIKSKSWEPLRESRAAQQRQ